MHLQTIINNHTQIPAGYIAAIEIKRSHGSTDYQTVLLMAK